MNDRLKNFPISFFAVVMGLTGATIAWKRTESIWNLNTMVSSALLVISSVVFLIILLFYATKIIKYPDDIRKEFKNITKLSFFPTISISLILLSIAWLESNTTLSTILWYGGTILQFIFTITIISIWIRHQSLEINAISPAWFIPVVGNILVPVAGVVHAPVEVSWFFFSIGLIFWVALFTILLYRLIFHNPLPERLLPTLFILIAPPAVGFISYIKLTGVIDPTARILYYFGLFIFLLMMPQLKMLSRIKYYLSWWAYTFPLAALTIATILMHHQVGLLFFKYLAMVLLMIVSVVIIMLMVMTIKAMKNKAICVEE
ncbi:MAG: SLAC1 anion channel family protein [Smithella sp.]|nr:SLAC1 anion channel family protein [Smithella sp.]MDM7987759.1 SLAC1 anion channel family protein [Smithella sp.]HOU51324.1 SLAC1 anion channel family protein [Smithella sp.]HQG66152.1 SLAC1 anion channel family protein [Smithella sp.]